MVMPRFNQCGLIRTYLEELKELCGDSPEAESASSDRDAAHSKEERSKESSPPARRRLWLGEDGNHDEDAFRLCLPGLCR